MSSLESSSGSSDRASRSAPFTTKELALLSGSTDTALSFAVTVMVVLCSSMLSFTSTLSGCAPSRTFCFTKVPKPCIVTVTVYTPAGTDTTLKLPSPPDLAEIAIPFGGVSRIVAPGIAAPSGSSTVPVTEPPVFTPVCGPAGAPTWAYTTGPPPETTATPAHMTATEQIGKRRQTDIRTSKSKSLLNICGRLERPSALRRRTAGLTACLTSAATQVPVRGIEAGTATRSRSQQRFHARQQCHSSDPG